MKKNIFVFHATVHTFMNRTSLMRKLESKMFLKNYKEYGYDSPAAAAGCPGAAGSSATPPAKPSLPPSPRNGLILVI